MTNNDNDADDNDDDDDDKDGGDAQNNKKNSYQDACPLLSSSRHCFTSHPSF